MSHTTPRPDRRSSEAALVVVGDPGLIRSENFQMTFLGIDDFRQFIDVTDAPMGAFTLVRRRAPASPGGWEWDLYAAGWNPLAADRDAPRTRQHRQPGTADIGGRETGWSRRRLR
ncbi:MAG TPA: hypothetical protein VG276_14570 [Actinomycetes bacterium]|jgi:hypothetical protein|nr:hypothetical protein [Actinomycetes bacterium]